MNKGTIRDPFAVLHIVTPDFGLLILPFLLSSKPSVEERTDSIRQESASRAVTAMWGSPYIVMRWMGKSTKLTFRTSPIKEMSADSVRELLLKVSVILIYVEDQFVMVISIKSTLLTFNIAFGWICLF